MNQLLSINDDTLVINKLQLNWTTGTVTHVGNSSVEGRFNVNGAATFNDIVAKGNITADTLTVKNLVNESGQSVESGSWNFNKEQDLNGKGLNWTWGDANIQLIYRTGGRIWTNGVFDLPTSSSYNINNIPVLTATSLGLTVTNSNLTKIGTLGSLEVSGDAVLGDFAFFNTAFNRLGLGTEEPNAAIDILENNVEITIGSPRTNLATIGTYSNHDLAITTDNIARITVKNGGEVHIGDEVSKAGVLRVYGSLYVDNLITKSSTYGNQLLSFDDDTVVVDKLKLNWTTGTVTHVGNSSVEGRFNVNGDATFNNIIANGNITADTLTVKTLINESGQSVDPGSWNFNQEYDLNDKGLNWSWGDGNVQLVYRTGKRLWTNGSFDVAPGSSYNINNVPVINAISLGASVTESSLTKLGTLKSLSVSGNTTLGNFAYFNTTINRLGLGTDKPTASIDILENEVGISIGKLESNSASIGTYSNHDLAIATNNITRITVKNGGEVHVGNESTKNGVLRVHGSLYVDNLITETRQDRVSPLQFQVDNDSKIYGLGLVWTGPSVTKQLTMRSSPDRLFSSESIDIANNQFYYINGQPALSSQGLGPSIVNSKLTSVGILNSLQVSGDTTLQGLLIGNSSTFKSVTLTDNVNSISISSTGIISSNLISIASSDYNVVSGSSSMIEIGDKNNQRKPVKVFGPLSVNVNNPDPTLSFSVGGDVSIGDKRFTKGINVPTSGNYNMGDICWNSRPQAGSYIGWVCITAGTPGQWLPFGSINTQ